MATLIGTLDKRVFVSGTLAARVLPVSTAPTVVSVVDDALDSCSLYAHRAGVATVSKTYTSTTVSAVYTITVAQTPDAPSLHFSTAPQTFSLTPTGA